MRHLIILFLLLFSSSLSIAGPYELRTGLTWTYELTGGEQNEVINSVPRSVVIDGVEWFELNEYGERFWVRNTEQGQVEAVNYYERDLDASEPIVESLVYKFPVLVDETWGDPDSPVIYLGLRDVTVPAGEFTCHLYRFDLGDGATSESCVSNGAGVVLNEFKNVDGTRQVSRLVRYVK